MRYVAFLFAALFVLTSLAPIGAAQVRLNEIMADPDTDWDGDGITDSKADEWVEVANTSGATVNLANFRLSDLSGGTEFRFALSGTLAPGEVAVFFGSAVVAWQQANGVGAFGFSLNNTGDTVYLYSVAGGDTTVSDSYAYTTNEVKDNRAVGRMPSGIGEWVIFDGLNPYTGTDFIATGCAPSPGAMTDCATATQEMSWGQMKSQYAIP